MNYIYIIVEVVNILFIFKLKIGDFKMKVIYVASPLSGNMELNQKRARVYCKYVKDKGFVPYAPHLLFTQFMNDEQEEDRKQAIIMNAEMLSRCDELWVFNDFGISKGMRAEIILADELKIPVSYVSLFDTEYHADL